MQHNDLLPFQRCTVEWIKSQLLSKKRSVHRFLVADEVGLGKTKIAAAIVEILKKQKKNLKVVYITSSLDVCEQNRKKLSSENSDLKTADRICLLYSKRIKNTGVNIISFTPSTSFNLTRSQGSMQERAYIMWLAYKLLGVRRKTLIPKLQGRAERRSFLGCYVYYKSTFNLPPKSVCKSIKREWAKNDLEPLLRAGKLKPEETKHLLSSLRRSMALAIVASLKPDLIILDEIQKFPELLKMEKGDHLEGPISRALFDVSVPTLALSATPYRAYVHTKQADSAAGHLEDLKEVFWFLSSSESKANELCKVLNECTSDVSKLNPTTVAAFREKKKKVESQLMHYMCRAERITFESNARADFIEKPFPPNKYLIEAAHIEEWLRVKGHVRSKRAYMHLWKSGQSPLSYLKDYTSVKEFFNKKGSLYRDKKLYSKLSSKHGQSKLRYLKSELMPNGIEKYLWIPPLKPYYKSTGIYSEKNLNQINLKKGLVFSSWAFVPRMIAAELTAWKKSKLKISNTKNPLKYNAVNWARFWHPSPWLAEIITHKELATNTLSFKELTKIIAARIEQSLQKEGWRCSPEAKTWELFLQKDIIPNSKLSAELKRYYKKASSSKEHGENKDFKKFIDQLNKALPSKIYSKKCITELSMVALTSPAVTLLRTLLSLGGSDHEVAGPVGLAKLSHFCLFNWKPFFNRDSTANAIRSAYSKHHLSYPEKLQAYFGEGNLQALLDEYVFHLQFSPKTKLDELLDKLKTVFAPKGGDLAIKIGPDDKTKHVHADIVLPFGKIDDVSQSRQSTREAFNSPFWPFVLATTSVGQEGLDFHLYCKDIFHWNLPSNPVDFEQREGRINRYSSFWVRDVILKSLKKIQFNDSFLWQSIYSEAEHSGHLFNRLSMGMSPHWSYTPSSKKVPRGYMRHILAMPGTNEELKYRSLMSDLTLYRLSLGQANQKDFVQALKKNEYLSTIDPRSASICLFPFNKKIIHQALADKYKKSGDHELLIKDSLALLGTLKNHINYKIKAKLVHEKIKILKHSTNPKLKKKAFNSLVFFVNPFDDTHDITPEVGYEDDIEVLRAA